MGRSSLDQGSERKGFLLLPAGLEVDPDVRSAERYRAAQCGREREAASGGGERLPAAAAARWSNGEDTSPRITMPRFGLHKLHEKPPNIRD